MLQERCITRLGGLGEIPINVRVVAATNRNLPELIKEGGFRDDLYYRINVVQVLVPPLRERKDDLPLLISHFLAKHFGNHRCRTPNRLPKEILKKIMNYNWPGNVRELANVVERLVLLSEDGNLSIADLPDDISNAKPDPGCPFLLPPGGICWLDVESGLICQALKRCSNNRKSAATLLGMSYKTLLYRIEKYQLG